MDDSDPFVHRLVGLHAEIGQAQPGLEVEVGDLARPALRIPLKALLGFQGEIRTQKVRRGFLPGVPSRNPNTDVEGHIFQSPLQGSDPIGRPFAVCSGRPYRHIPLVLEGACLLVDAFLVELAIGLDSTDHVPVLAADELDQPGRRIPGIEQDIDRPTFG